ncbi:MAG: YihY/virulence factor BrkB family protein [Chloroflexota bacterium]
MRKTQAYKRNTGAIFGRGVIGILISTLRSFSHARGAEAAASIAYYALFSLFPLLIFLVVLGSLVLESEQVQRQVLNFVAEVFPASQDLVARNIQQVLRLRGAVGLIGIVGLLWSATAVFSALVRNINRAWHTAPPRNFLIGRLMALTMVGGLAVLLLLSFLATTAIRLLSHFEFLLWGGVPITQTSTWAILSRLIPWLLTFLIFQGLYRWVPNTEVKWSEAFWGALFATTAWEFTKAAFRWYISSGLASQQLVYGSLGAVIALLVWIYLSSLITLLGAHLSAAITHYNQAKSTKIGQARQRPSR